MPFFIEIRDTVTLRSMQLDEAVIWMDVGIVYSEIIKQYNSISHYITFDLTFDVRFVESTHSFLFTVEATILFGGILIRTGERERKRERKEKREKSKIESEMKPFSRVHFFFCCYSLSSFFLCDTFSLTFVPLAARGKECTLRTLAHSVTCSLARSLSH